MTALARASRSTELSLVAMAFIWGVNFSVMKYGTQQMVLPFPPQRIFGQKEAVAPGNGRPSAS